MNRSASVPKGRQRHSSMFSTKYGNSRRGNQQQERIRLTQLCVCLILFLTVFIGKGVFPHKMVQLSADMRSLLSQDMDIRGALSDLGASLSTGESSLLDELGGFCVQVFGPEPELPASTESDTVASPKLTNLLDSEIQSLSVDSTSEALTAHYLHASYIELPIKVSEHQLSEDSQSEDLTSVDSPAAVPAAGTVLLKADYSGQQLPEHYTMDWLSLGELKTITPVLGNLNSEFGYRDHPINGTYQFHGGVDIGGQTGDPILAFASGTVEYIGEDTSYGLYLQLDHGNGVKSFYAHCNKLLVSKGQNVTAGEKIAEVGSSGSATGPHLHLELKYNEMHLNPIYYLEFLSKQ